MASLIICLVLFLAVWSCLANGLLSPKRGKTILNYMQKRIPREHKKHHPRFPEQKCYDSDLRDKRHVACTLIFYLKITSNFFELSTSYERTSSEALYYKLKAGILERCHQSLPDFVIDKVFLQNYKRPLAL